MNKQLIEKWRAKLVAISFDNTKDKLDDLRLLLKVVAPYDEDYPRSGILKYYHSIGEGLWNISDFLPAGMTAVPLSQFFEEEKQPTSQPMKPYIEYLAEKHYNFDEQTNNDLQAAADKFAEDRMVAFSIWCSDNQWEITIDGKIWVKIIKQKPVYKTTSELIAIFNSETTV